MAERPRLTPIDFAAIVANIGRAIPEGGADAAAEAAVDVLAFLEERAEELGAAPGPAAHLAVLDLCAALLAFGGERDIEELIAWLRKELPARARELAKAVSASIKLTDVPLCSCLATPEPATWH
jgi:hypothetical protein